MFISLQPHFITAGGELVGKHMNPGNEAFREALQTYYVDKTGMIALINRTINTKMELTCISRPRRFGKSYAVQMLCAEMFSSVSPAVCQLLLAGP